MPAIWKTPVTVEAMAAMCADTAVTHLGIEFLELGPDFLRARVPVDARTPQPYGLLHGGVSVLLAETIGSMAAHFAAAPGCRVVGLEINANHLRAVRSGWVTGTGRPLHLGRSTQVWQIEMVNDEGQPTCISRITIAVLAPGKG